MTITGTNMSMTRGDTELITVKCSVPFAYGDTVYMTVREDAESDVQFQKIVTDFNSAGEAVIRIEHDDTEGMDFGNYLYDIQVTRADGTVRTLVKPARFTLTEEITYD